MDRLFTDGLEEPEIEHLKRFDSLFIDVNRYFITPKMWAI
jgi:hypothetical protein